MACAVQPALHDAKDGPPTKSVDVSKISNAQPKTEPLSRHGNPPSYRIGDSDYQVMYDSSGYKETGIASWYGTKFHNQLTSSGEPYDMFAMTAAHKQLPLPTYVRVKNLENDREIIVKVTDRGPFKADRLIDLSYVAAKKLGILEKGTGMVEIEAIQMMDHPKNVDQQNLTPSSKQIFLQVGAFDKRENAEQLQQELQYVINHTILINPTADRKKNSYRVQIGPFEQASHIETLSSQLQAIGIEGGFTVVE